jgi:hypothetical protein
MARMEHLLDIDFAYKKGTAFLEQDSELAFTDGEDW